MYRTAFVIDDSPIDRTLSSVVLQKQSFAEHIVCFSSGLDALEYIREHKHNPDSVPEVIFLDIHMPLMNGFGFLDKYLELESDSQNWPIVFFVSSSINDCDHDKIKNYPIVRQFVSKPMTMDVLAELMQSLR